MGPPDPSDIRDRRFERNVARLCELGPRAVGELLAELGASSLRMTEIEATLARYARLDPVVVRDLDGDRFAPRPTLRVVGGLRHG